MGAQPWKKSPDNGEEGKEKGLRMSTMKQGTDELTASLVCRARKAGSI